MIATYGFLDVLIEYAKSDDETQIVQYTDSDANSPLIIKGQGQKGKQVPYAFSRLLFALIIKPQKWLRATICCKTTSVRKFKRPVSHYKVYKIVKMTAVLDRLPEVWPYEREFDLLRQNCFKNDTKIGIQI